MKDLSFRIPVVTYGVLTPTETSKTTSRGRVRIFYKGLNRNGTYITEEFAQKLISTLPYTPVKGIYGDDDFTDHGEERSEGRIYGVVPENPNFAWEDFTDDDGVTRTYACCDVLLYTALYEEACDIFGKGESMELYLRSIEGDWQVKEGKKCFVFSDGCFLGLQALGDDVEPCFEGAAFYDCAAFYDFNQSIYTILEKASGGNQMDDLNKEVFEEEVSSKEATEETPVEAEAEATEEPVLESSVEDNSEEGSEDASSEVDSEVEETSDDSQGADAEVETNTEETTEEVETEEEASAESEETNYSEKISELESKISELEALNSTLQLERDTFSSQLEEAKGEISSLQAEVAELSQFKNEKEIEQKMAVIEEYASKLSEEVIQKYTNSLNAYSVEGLDKELCYEVKKGNPSAFFGSKDGSTGVIPKKVTPSNYVDSVSELLKKYENK